MGKIAIFEQYLPLGLTAARVSSVVNSFEGEVIYSTKRRCLFIAQTVATNRHAQ